MATDFSAECFIRYTVRVFDGDIVPPRSLTQQVLQVCLFEVKISLLPSCIQLGIHLSDSNILSLNGCLFSRLHHHLTGGIAVDFNADTTADQGNPAHVIIRVIGNVELGPQYLNPFPVT